MFSQVQEIQETEEKMNLLVPQLNLLVIQKLIHLKGYPYQVKVINMLVNSIKIEDIHNMKVNIGKHGSHHHMT
jgi:hypothetical protein